jgi:hypothetical protein
VDYDSAVEVLRSWCGRVVTVVQWTPTFDPLNRPYRGRLREAREQTMEDATVFTVPTVPADDRLTNSDGITFAVYRTGLNEASWAGGPEPGAGIALRQGALWITLFVDPA